MGLQKASRTESRLIHIRRKERRNIQMDRETFKNELMIRRRQQYLATLTPLGKAVLKAKILVADLANDERRCEGLQNVK
jgi:hypothetical protein